MKNLRVAVVPTETNNGIDQSSTVEQILACEETLLFPVTDYFKAQNDEEFAIHWSFLIDIETNEDLTGSNIDGIHMNTKAIQISLIKAIIERWGETTATELELDRSPVIASMGNHVNVSELVEDFNKDGVETITYQDENTLGYTYYEYEELSDDIILEILEIMDYYDADMDKTQKRIED